MTPFFFSLGEETSLRLCECKVDGGFGVTVLLPNIVHYDNPWSQKTFLENHLFIKNYLILKYVNFLSKDKITVPCTFSALGH